MPKPDPRAIVPVSFAKRLTQTVTYGLTGGWFSPQLPLLPQQPQTAGRRFDYIAGYNISTKPRRDSGIDFWTLRNFARYYDIMRILIEKRKDQISNFDWSIVPSDEVKTGGMSPNDELNSNAKAAQEFLKFPDGRTPWNTWLRVLMEDLLVIDAITIWPVYEGKKLVRLEYIDPATIKIVIDESGRRPEPPFPAYQQVLHGIPTADFRRDELLYYMSNPRSDAIYGLSKVEQVLITINIGLRRQASQLQFFSEGNVPAAIAGVPENWNMQQIITLQNTFDALLAGDTAARRRLWFLPKDSAANIHEFRPAESLLKAEFDEWLIRILCFNFGIAPTPFIKEQNRATAFTAQEQARDEGLGPQLTFIKSVMDDVIKNGLKMKGVEFKWSMEQENDPSTQATIDDTMLRNGQRSLDDLRQRDGLDPYGIGAMIYLPTGPIMIQDIIDGKYAPQPPQPSGDDGSMPPGDDGQPPPDSSKPTENGPPGKNPPDKGQFPPGKDQQPQKGPQSKRQPPAPDKQPPQKGRQQPGKDQKAGQAGAKPLKAGQMQPPAKDEKQSSTKKKNPLVKYSEDQPRDAHGRFGSGGEPVSATDEQGYREVNLDASRRLDEEQSQREQSTTPYGYMQDEDADHPGEIGDHVYAESNRIGDAITPPGSLSESETHALLNYGDAGYYHDINTPLREGKPLIEESNPLSTSDGTQRGYLSTAEVVAGLDSALSHSQLPENMNLYRGINNWQKVFGVGSEDELVGKTVRDNGFISTSVEKSIAAPLGSTVKDSFLTVAQIRCPQGMHAVAMTPNFTEFEEVILPRGTSFKITSVVHEGNVRHITMEPVMSKSHAVWDHVGRLHEKVERFIWKAGDLMVQSPHAHKGGGAGSAHTFRKAWHGYPAGTIRSSKSEASRARLVAAASRSVK